MSKPYDVIVIGGGHNGLTTAAYLANAGRKVLVLEKRSVLGGIAATEEIFPGFKFNTGYMHAGSLQDEVVDDLKLKQHGLEFIEPAAAVFAPQPDGRTLTIWRDEKKSQSEIAKFSQKDAEMYSGFVRLTDRLSAVLNLIAMRIPPDVIDLKISELLPWLKVGLAAKQLGDQDMIQLLRTLPMTAQELMNEWFESDAVQGALGSPGTAGSQLGPQSGGTAFMLLYQQIGAANGGYRSVRYARGGSGTVTAALAKAAESYGAEISVGTAVTQIILEGGKAVGVRLADGEEIRAKTIASSANPRHTFFDLAGPQAFEIRVMRRISNIRYRGCTTRLNLSLSGLPIFSGAPEGSEHLTGYTVICPSLDYLEKAYNHTKYGEISENPYLELTIPSILDDSLAPAGQHTMSINMQFAPYKLSDGDWQGRKDPLANQIIETLSQYAPNLKSLILQRQMITPLDYEREYSLPEGSFYQGEMGLDQLLIGRPVAGYAQYASQIPGLYLCGSGAHPGGGLTGAPGHNAAKKILKVQ